MPLTNSQYDEIMRNYDYLRQTEAQALKERKEEVFKTVPEIRELRERIIDLHMDSFFSEEEVQLSRSQDIKQSSIIVHFSSICCSFLLCGFGFFAAWCCAVSV